MSGAHVGGVLGADGEDAERGLVTAIAARLAHLKERIAMACPAGRDPSQVSIVAASKQQPASVVRAAYAASQIDFGENYAQELAAKRPLLTDLCDESLSTNDRLRWHFIGALQSNKARLVVGCTLIHGVDRLSVLEALDKAAAQTDRIVEVLIEIHSGDASKSGVAPQALGSLLDQAGRLPHLRIAGLMGIAPLFEEAAAATQAASQYFESIRALRDRESRLRRAGVDLRHLSMGMSDDLELAVAAGATIVRVGTALLGPRPSRTSTP